MPRFTIKDLLLTTTLIAIGAGMFACIGEYQRAIAESGNGGLLVALWFGGGACIGAGLMAPFKRLGTGALIAFGIQVVIVVMMYIAFH
jgi:hypothetical protein